MPATSDEELVMLRQAHYDLNLLAADMADHIATLYQQRADRIRRDADMLKRGGIVVAFPKEKENGQRTRTDSAT